MTKDALLLQAGFVIADLERHVAAHPGCLDHDEEFRIMRMRRQLERVAREGGTIAAYIDGTAGAPMPSLGDAA